MSDREQQWRSPEERENGRKPEARFNPFNNDFLSRREFMEWTSGMVAVLGASACTRMPDQKMIPYTKQPERIIPGQPLFYATAMTLNGRACGLLVESHMGRPTKIEGNPEHPASLGATDVFAQASVLSLYDPDRSQSLVSDGNLIFWGAFVSKVSALVKATEPRKGDGLRILTEPVVSPSLAAQIQDLLKRFPQAQWHQYEPVHRDNEREGALDSLGEDVTPVFDFTQAKVVVSLDADFLGDPSCPRYAHDFAQGRNPSSGAMNRLYAVEGSPSITGAKADNLLVARACDIEGIAAALAAACGVSVQGAPKLSGYAAKWVDATAADLKANGGSSVVVAGRWQSKLVHSFANAINSRLKNVGRAVKYIAPLDSAGDQTESIRRLAADMKAGKVETLLILGGNPVYNAPVDLDFGGLLGKVKNRIHCGLYFDETASACNHHVPEAHYLEAWGDARAYDGTVSIVQPLIAPLYGGKAYSEVLAALVGETAKSYDQVRAYWKARATGDFEKFWSKSLNDGFVANTAAPAKSVALKAESGWAKVSRGAKPDAIEVILRPDPTVFDGRFSNNGWLQELGKPLTKLTWDNAALFSPATAAKLKLANGDVVRIAVGEKVIEAAAWVSPGHAPNSLTLSLGYGRTKAGKLGNGTGFNAYPLRGSTTPWNIVGAEVTKTGGTYKFANIQDHGSMEGRPIVRTATLLKFKEDPHFTHLAHPIPHALADKNVGTAGGGLEPTGPADYQWGMAVNLSSCNGCNACVVACQAENNIPVVGKEEVARGREMAWLRLDRYYEGDLESPKTHFQPVACVHCETAPCEIVCPVGATMHDNEGLNNMVYNRCVGTKYCSNNCPYKVRRFNFFEYTNTITPSTKMVQNPNVTVRGRGVMEKCTYCVQRISAARITAKNEKRTIRDGEVKTACQSACPAGAITFGNIADANSQVSKVKAESHNYGLLEELNTRPRTTYLGKVVNPNPALEAEKPA